MRIFLVLATFYWEKVNWPKFSHYREFFRLFFDKNTFFLHKSALENGGRLKFVWAPTIYLSRVKKLSLYLLGVTNDSVFKSAPLHITAYFRRK